MSLDIHPRTMDRRTTRRAVVDLSERMRLLRFRLGWTQTQLAQQLDVCLSTVIKHEARNRKHRMDKSTLRRFEILEKRWMGEK